MNPQNLLQQSGFSFDYKTIFIALGFSIVGMGAWRYGRKTQSARHMILGLCLMIYSYFVPNPWLSLLVGSILTLLLFWPPL